MAPKASEKIQVPRAAAKKQPKQAEVPPAPRFIADTVKQLVLRGELKLGAPVTEKWLTSKFDTSRTTVREAINILVAERYLDQEPYKSAKVRSYSAKGVADIIESRRLIESYAARQCAVAAKQQVAALRSAFANYGNLTLNNEDTNSAALAHVELHVAIVGLTGNEELIKAERELMTGQLLLVDLINFDLQDADKMYFEHSRIINALLEPNPQLAEELIHKHLDMVHGASNAKLPSTNTRSLRQS